MKGSWYSILLVAGLLGLLVLLAFLQYRWLGQISTGERERLQKRLQTDTERFAEDFNREIQQTYFAFQFDADVWRQKNYAQFNELYELWKSKSSYPDLIEDFYFMPVNNSPALLHYDTQKREFVATEWTDKLRNIKSKINVEGFDPIEENECALIMPIHETRKYANEVILNTGASLPPLNISPKYGFLIITLDENILKGKVLSELARKYFSENEGAKYKVAIVNSQDSSKTIFQTQNETLNSSDATANLFSLQPKDFSFFINKDLISSIKGDRKSVLVRQKIETRVPIQSVPTKEQQNLLTVQVSEDNVSKSETNLLEGNNFDVNGIWTLNVQHVDGSLDQFVSNARRKNLAISFGILFLLGASIVLIFISARRVRNLAQRQLDFISSVSHEFRTPLAVIYSASENLTDGVVDSKVQVKKYGGLIKREGKKLSEMVEQILEFAGARSGRRKYDFRDVEIKKIIENALADCKSLIDEKDFKIETEVGENIPQISADEKALSQAIQNLIANGLKYSDNTRQLKISAKNGGNSLKIAVEDYGIGISPKDLRHIFEPFFRARAVVDAQIHGNGLGLNLVKQVVEAHGGKIKVESKIGKGSKFIVYLPLNN